MCVQLPSSERQIRLLNVVSQIWDTHSYLCRIKREPNGPLPFVFPPLTAEEAAFFVPSAPKIGRRQTNAQIPWLTYLVKSGWYGRDTPGDQELILKGLQRPRTDCSIAEPARTQCLLLLRGLYGFHTQYDINVEGCPWQFCAADVAPVIRLLKTYYYRKGQDLPSDNLDRLAPVFQQSLVFHTLGLKPEGHVQDQLAVRRMVDWVENLDEDEQYKACLRDMTDKCIRTARANALGHAAHANGQQCQFA
ncbi:hypothetical protein JCM10296v2_002708 [Rhodotorula toruloides]